MTLDYQAGDLEDELLEAATPTPTRRAKHCFLQVQHIIVSSSRRQTCRELSCRVANKQADRYVVPVNELADALGITRGNPARLRKAGYGLVIAPKAWVESVCDGVKELGLVPCNRSVCIEARQGNVTRTTAALVGAVSH